MFNTATVLLLLVVPSVSSDGEADKTISCTSQGTVQEGDSAAVVCSYHQNLQKNQSDFYIYRSQNDQEAVIVAICAWEKSSSQLSCDLKTGYSVSVNASKVTLDITSALPDHAGKYKCSTLPPTPGVEIQPCHLSVKEKANPENKVRAFCRNDRQEASVMCIYPENLDTRTMILERHDLLSATKPVEVMRCDTKGEACTTSLAGYQPITNSQTPDNFKTVGVTIHSYAASKSGVYVCKTDSDSIACDMCTLKNVQVSTRQDTETEAVRLLLYPLYAIFACLLLVLLLLLTCVFYRCKRAGRARNATATGQQGQQSTLLNHTDLNGASRV